MKLSRRTFLATTLAGAAVAGGVPLLRRAAGRRFTGGIVGGNSSLGHALRDGKLPSPSQTAEVAIAIVGGGIAGLAAARQLQRAGFVDFLLLELEGRVGGNSVSGRNEVSAYPWGAHYVPLVGSDATELTQLFEELGVITGHDGNGLPIYRDEFLCADPMERLFLHGRWQEGLVPQIGLTADDQRAMESFFAEMQRLKNVRGRDGKRAFTIPLDQSSRDEEFTQLDRITMVDYLRGQGWVNCAPLRWYVNYCCRDDYGAGVEKVSAWAGVHYFASRDGKAANAPGYAFVTWPEGNGWLVDQLRRPSAPRIRSSCAVWNVETDGRHWLVDYYDAKQGRSIRLRAHGVVWAAPRFIAQRTIRELKESTATTISPVYSPWIVANLTLDTLPGGSGVPLAWDNVIYSGHSLGYVVATHQHLHPFPKRTVITYYQPLDADEPSVARHQAMMSSYDQWCDVILAELSRAHPDIARHVTHLDIWLWGHAMVRPVPGFIWGSARHTMLQPLGKLVFAHTDVSGLAIFEEAYTRGVRAAADLLRRLDDSKLV